ncbi:MAG: hypothetical protein D6701_09790, partial [Gemmatimonadetes bacterium]
ADPGAAARFFELYRTRVRPYARVADLLESEPGGPEFMRYLATLGHAFDLYSALLLPPDSGGAPQSRVEIEVDFRTDRQREIGAENIAEWAMRIGNRTFRHGDSVRARTVDWHLADPVVLTLRWADQSPVIPAPTAGGQPVVRGRTVEYRFTGPWALLRAISELASGPGRASDAGWQTLRVDVPLAPADATAPEAATPEDGAARVFLRIQVRHPVTKAWVAVPDLGRPPPPFPGG